MSDTVRDQTLLELSSQIVSAYVSKNPVSSSELGNIVKHIHNTLSDLQSGKSEQATASRPMVSVRKSVGPDYLVCLEDGKKLKMLKRYLRTKYKMSPEEYRAKWSLPADYPMVAPNYAKLRSEFAKKIGLGKKTSKKSKRPRRAG